MKKHFAILAVLCLLTTVGCGDKKTNSKTDMLSAAEDSKTSAEPAASQEITKEFILPELSDEIPAETVTKVTISVISDDKTNLARVEYRDGHDNHLLIMEPDSNNELKVTRNLKYKYNENGDSIYKWELSRSSLNEIFTEYDQENRYTEMKCIQDNKLSWESKYEYDKYGNQILDETTYYNDDDGSVMAVFTNDFSDCDYDSEGHVIAAREYKSDGSLYKTYSYTYNSEGQKLTEKEVKENFDPEEDKYKFSETKYEYSSVSDIPSLKDEIDYNEDGSVFRETIMEREFDSSGRITKVTTHYNSGSVEIYCYEYESC